jgi:periplasmic divalent cation tolerance protein
LTDACVALVTCGSLSEAESIAETIVLEALAACVNIIGGGNPVRSFYIWEGALQKEEEYLLFVKTFSHKLEALEARIRELHSYTVPEFIVLPVLYGAKNYIHWMTQCIK